jgi:hypothetical protein
MTQDGGGAQWPLNPSAATVAAVNLLTVTRFTLRDLVSGPEDLRAQLPIGAATTAIRTAPDGTGQYFCARLDAPLKWHYGPDLDTSACAAQFLGRDRAGEFLWVDDIVLCAHHPDEQPHFGMRHFAVDLFAVTNPSLLTDAHVDPTKTHLVGIAEIDDADNTSATGFAPAPRLPSTTVPASPPPPRPSPVVAAPKPPQPAPKAPQPAPPPPPPPPARPVPAGDTVRPAPDSPEPPPAAPPPAPAPPPTPTAAPAPPLLSTAAPPADRDRVVAVTSVPRPAAPREQPPNVATPPPAQIRPAAIPDDAGPGRDDAPLHAGAEPDPAPEPVREAYIEPGDTGAEVEHDEDIPSWLDPAARPGGRRSTDLAGEPAYGTDFDAPAPRPYTPPVTDRPARPASGHVAPPAISVPPAPLRDTGKLVRILGAAAVLLGLIVGATMWAFHRGSQTDDSASAPDSSTTSPTSDTAAPAPAPTTDPRQVDRLLKLLPPGYPPQACRPIPADTGLATVTCDPTPDPEGPRTATYTLAATKTDLDEQFQAVIATATQVICPGNIQSPGPWRHNATPQQEQGILYCGFRGQVPVVAWTDVDKLVLHVTESSPDGPNMETLFRWWSTHS